MTHKHLFFDCFGTLIDTEQSSLRATKKMLSELAPDIDPVVFYKQWKAMNGDACYLPFRTEAEAFLENFNQLMALYGESARVDSIDYLRHEMINRKPFGDALEVIKRLSRVAKVYVASNSDHYPLECCLEPFVPYLSGIYSSEQFQTYKPQAGFFHSMLEESQVEASDSFYIGDSIINDVVAPERLGIRSYLIDRTSSEHGLGWPSLSDFADEIVRRLAP
ncbi:HAD family hydrolase [Aestuariirhabdus sp. Z084]|uniref:HAD family hydrolase n=1 Tax=Aestuariirhabdus haliotis TaxID=2918751 RepID=UPI00201B3FC1|nr:HAD family hydrolase [Aestuariirhabdus haliotis]MCL6414031.1 HAD family hydrolase [Aestuariirhabdus haliotis]MCL6417964.1 HAD family hydrolase [Aestuariirhabdus haliotis]